MAKKKRSTKMGGLKKRARKVISDMEKALKKLGTSTTRKRKAKKKKAKKKTKRRR